MLFVWKYIFDNSTGNIKIVSDTESVSKAESDAESGSLHIHLYAGVYTELNAGLEKFPLFGLSQSSLSAKSLGSRSASNIRCNKASTVRYPGKKKKETPTESEDSISQSNCYSPRSHIFTLFTLVETCCWRHLNYDVNYLNLLTYFLMRFWTSAFVCLLSVIGCFLSRCQSFPWRRPGCPATFP